MKRRLASFAHAFRGIGAALRSEPNLRLQLLAAIAVAIAGWWLEIRAGEWLAVIVAMALVLVAELFNTALEALADAVHPERHEGIGRAKDAAAGAVLVAAIAAAAIGAIVFLPKLLEKLSL